MPFTVLPLDASYVKKENITIILGRTIILKILEDVKTKTLLNDKEISQLVKIKNFCNNDIQALFNDLIQKEEYITAPSFVKQLIDKKDEFIKLEPILNQLNQIMKNLTTSPFIKSLEEAISEGMKSQETKIKEKLSNKKLQTDLLFKLKGEVKKDYLHKSETQLLAIEKKIEEKTGISITSQSVLLVCSNCNTRLFEQEIENKKCTSCNSKITDKEIKRIPLRKIPEKIKRFFKSNLWFEAYVGNLFKKLGYQTWVNVSIMGSSGILHQIDVLGINKKHGLIAIAECKTGRISRKDVFNFSTKARDIHAHSSLLAMMNSLPEPETKAFVEKDRTIILLENVGNRDEDEIFKFLQMNL